MSSRVSLLLAVTAALVALLPCVCGQVLSTATCLSQYDWMNNSRSQSPCLVAAYLESACTNGDFQVTPLPIGTHYSGPSQQQANTCSCSTVTFSMISACGICQDRVALLWNSWSFNCTTIYSRKFTETIPANTAVPAWAYLDVETSNTFDPAAAHAAASAPESTGGPSATAVATPASAPSKSKKSNTGAIVGGVVGGVVGLCLLLGVMAFCIIRRRRRQTAPSAAYDSTCKNGRVNSPIPSLPMNQAYAHSLDHGTYYSSTPQSPPKLYDPSDPSTFPSPSPPSTLYTTNSDHVTHGQPKTQPGQFTFIPEI